MKYYPLINDKIEELSQKQILKRRQKLILPIIILFVGLAVMGIGILKWSAIGYEETSYALVFGGLFIVGWAIVMLSSNSNYYVFIPTGERVVPERVYLDPDKKEEITEFFSEGKLGHILKNKIKDDSPLMIELWKVDGHHLLYSQVLYYNDAETRGITPAAVHEKDAINSDKTEEKPETQSDGK